MLIAAGAMEGLIYYLANFTPSSTPGRSTVVFQTEDKLSFI